MARRRNKLSTTMVEAKLILVRMDGHPAQKVARSQLFPSNSSTSNSCGWGRIVQALSKVDRLQSISYSEGTKEAASATLPILSMLDGKAAARLEHLSLKASADRDELFMTLPPTFLNGGCPRLRSVDINGFVILWSSSLLSGLTSLKLETPSRNQPFGTLKELLDAFERMPHLSHFQLNWVIGTIIDSPDESRVVEMHKMEDFVLHTLFTDCTRILKHIALPHHASLTVEALGTGNGQEWFPCNFISSSLIPALAAAINSSWLSNPLSSSPSLRTDNPISQTAPTSLAPIHTIIWINNPTNSLHRITIFFHRQDDELNQTPSETTQAETQKMPTSELMLAMTVAHKRGIDELAQNMLALLPLPQLHRVIIHGDFSPGIFEVLGNIPTVKLLSLTNQSFLNFLEYSLDSTHGSQTKIAKGTQAQQSTENCVSTPGPDTLLNADLNPSLCFPVLYRFALISVDLGENERSAPMERFTEFLRLRRDVGCPIEVVQLSSCSGITKDDLANIKSIVPKVDAVIPSVADDVRDGTEFGGGEYD